MTHSKVKATTHRSIRVGLLVQVCHDFLVSLATFVDFRDLVSLGEKLDSGVFGDVVGTSQTCVPGLIQVDIANNDLGEALATEGSWVNGEKDGRYRQA